MNRKKMVSVIALVMVILMVLSLIAVAIPSAYAIDQSDIDALQSRKNELSQKVKDCKERLSALNEQQANVLEQKNALLEENRLAQEQLDLVQQQIDIYEEIIAEQAEAVEEAKSREDVQLQKYRTRVRQMEENGSYNYNILALVLRVGNLSELLSAVDDMGEIMESDKILEEQYVEAREETEEVKAEYEAVKQEYEGKETVLLDEQAQIKEQMKTTNQMLEDLAEDIEKALEEYQAAEAAEQAASAEISATIAEWNRQKAAAAAAAAAQTQTVTTEVVNEDGTVTTVTQEVPVENPAAGISGTGSFIWPVPCSMRVTSRYGNRSDPFTGATAYHSGIDIDGFGNDGSAIIAADSGMVITASYSDGYGNYVIIDHGNTKTVYAHMSGFAVSAGQTVTQGQTIGYLGATGRATGTHCHFEVYVGDSRVDPASYFSGISYYNC
ncbi:MAG: peptidoglycan DD-metalloendopeptidase family protein [Eubacteriales bacterium]|nr:peptidoglycan DD-metalloendopeptidase family protein [Eubacteriales bacterium]